MYNSKIKVFLLCCFVSLSFIFAGLFIEICIPASDKALLANSVGQMFISGSGTFSAALLMNLIWILLICISGLSVYGSIFSVFLLLGKMLSLGFCAGLLNDAMNDTWLKAFMTVMLPPNIIIVPAFIFAAFSALDYSRCWFSKNSSRIYPQSRYFFTFTLIALAVAAACTLESICIHFFY